MTPLREAYRLAYATPDGARGKTLETVEDSPLFDTWKAADRAALERTKTDGRRTVCVAVLVDQDGRVVFPPPETVRRSRARWHCAPVIQVGPRSDDTDKRRPPTPSE